VTTELLKGLRTEDVRFLVSRNLPRTASSSTLLHG